jgi:Sec7-like guanine-nucleotide exchange factor
MRSPIFAIRRKKSGSPFSRSYHSIDRRMPSKERHQTTNTRIALHREFPVTVTPMLWVCPSTDIRNDASPSAEVSFRLGYERVFSARREYFSISAPLLCDKYAECQRSADRVYSLKRKRTCKSVFSDDGCLSSADVLRHRRGKSKENKDRFRFPDPSFPFFSFSPFLFQKKEKGRVKAISPFAAVLKKTGGIAPTGLSVIDCWRS